MVDEFSIHTLPVLTHALQLITYIDASTIA